MIDRVNMKFEEQREKEQKEREMRIQQSIQAALLRTPPHNNKNATPVSPSSSQFKKDEKTIVFNFFPPKPAMKSPSHTEASKEMEIFDFLDDDINGFEKQGTLKSY